MKLGKFGKYFLNCFLLLMPIYIWNLIFMDSLPNYYSNATWDDIPLGIAYSENILKAIVFILPFIMMFSLKSKTQKIGFGLYIVGIIVYFLSWTAQIYFPESSWSKSLLGVMAPAYTTIIWFVGIGLIGKNSFLKVPYMSAIYIILSVCFVIIHSIHPYIVFQKI